MVQSEAIEFLYPTSRQFPFDEVCEQIVRELEKRNWKVPGIKVGFNEYGSGEQKFRHVECIKGGDFKLRFYRKQRTMPGGAWNDVAAVSEILIPKKELHVHEDESGPGLYFYVGNKWKRDRKIFMDGIKVNSRLEKKPRMYLLYSGQCWCRDAVISHTHPGHRSPLLAHDSNLGREYDELKTFRTTEVMNEFKQYLKANTLKIIKARPIPKKQTNKLTPVKYIPFPQLDLGEIFAFAGYSDKLRIELGKENKDNLEPSDRYSLTANGYRLMSLDTPNDGTVPEVAYEGFLWCGIASTLINASINSLEIPGSFGLNNEQFIIRVKPSRANGVYIADHAPYKKRREEIAEIMKDRDNYTSAEIADFICARARTIIPISKYKGGYEQPVILINRELSFDEVEIVSGPHKHRFYR